MGVTKRREELRHGCGGMYTPHMRENADGSESRTIEGYAIVFGQESVLIADYWGDPYREVIEKGAITAEELNGMDIKMTIWHNRERLLARANKGKGTLKLEVDDKGVKYSFEAPNTPDGNTALELVKRGDLSGSSFTYWTDESHNVSYEKGKDKELIRHVNKISEVMEMTIASDPAYTETSVTAREVESTGFRLKEEEQREEAPKQEMKGPTLMEMEREQRERELNY